tara:strand:- start:28 stop:738 length:711 start_codon:yes stop_codon:yes gene_type:complete
MIKFFRKIRQNLLTENKFSKYILYAIGEIILVVIGILIALQLNVSKQNHSNQNKVNKYLALILEDLDNDRARFVFCKNTDSLRAEHLNQYIYSGKTVLSNQTIKSAFATQTSVIHNSTYNSIKSNNILELIKNVKIQKAISEYYSLADKVQRFEYAYISNQHADFTREVVKRKNIVQFVHQMKSKSENITLTEEEDSIFYGHFVNMRDNAKLEADNYNELIKEIEILTDLLNREIN